MKPTAWKRAHGWGLFMVYKGRTLVSMPAKKKTAIKQAAKICKTGSAARVEFFDDGEQVFSCQPKRR